MLNRMCGDMHLFKKMAAFFWLNKTKGAPLKAAARRPNRPTTKVGKTRWESAGGSVTNGQWR